MGEDFKNFVFFKYKYEILNVFIDFCVIILVIEM